MRGVAQLAGGRRNGISPLSSPGSSAGNRCQVPPGTRFALPSEWPSLPLRIIRVLMLPLVPTGTRGAVRKRRCCIRRSRRTGLRFESAWKRAAGCRSLSSASLKSTSTVGGSRQGSLSRTKYLLRNTPERVTLIRPHHPLQGEVFEVLRGGKKCVTILLSDGTAMRVPRDWTDADGVRAEVSSRTGAFSIASLRSLLELVELLSTR